MYDVQTQVQKQGTPLIRFCYVETVRVEYGNSKDFTLQVVQASPKFLNFVHSVDTEKIHKFGTFFTEDRNS
jgi:hypothetical protein